MKISRVQAWPLEVPVDLSEIGVDRAERSELLFAEVETDTGLVGHGLSSITDPRPVAAAINAVLGPALIGLDPMLHERIWHVMFWTATPWGQTGYASHAISAIDLALWDIKGMAVGQPVWKLLGGARDRVEAYATCGFSFLDDDALGESVTRMVASGFRGVKIQVGRPGRDTRRRAPSLAAIVKADARRVRLVRDAVGADVELAVDAGCRLDLPHAYDLCRLIAEYDIAWFEEPILQNDVRLLADLRRRQPIKLTAGQNEGLAYRFRDMLAHNAVDAIQPNVIITGGITQCLRIAGLADAFNVPISNGGGCPHYNMHLQAGLQHGTNLEYQVNSVNACRAVFRDLPDAVDGYMALPEAPGLGLEPDRSAIESFALT